MDAVTAAVTARSTDDSGASRSTHGSPPKQVRTILSAVRVASACVDRMPSTRRSQLHCLVGNALEAQHADHVNEVAAELAVHFEEGRDYDKAVTYFEQAADNAARRSAHQEAATLARRGVGLLARMGESPDRARLALRLQLTLGASLIATKGYSAEEIEHIYNDARERCRRLGETPDLFRAMWALGRFYLVRTPLQTARTSGEEMLRFAERAKDPDFLLQAHNSLGAPLFHLGELEQALVHFEQGLDLYDPERHRSHAYLYVQDPRVVCLARSAVTLWCLGRPEQALERADRRSCLRPAAVTSIQRGVCAELCRLVPRAQT